MRPFLYVVSVYCFVAIPAEEVSWYGYTCNIRMYNIRMQFSSVNWLEAKIYNALYDLLLNPPSDDDE